MKNIIFSFICILICGTIMGFTQAPDRTPKTYTIEQFLNTTAFDGGAYSHDEKHILYSSDESGVMNVYSKPVQGGQPTQLTHSTHHSIYLVDALPHDDRFIFSQDGLGDELTHLYLQDANGSVRDLTPYPGAKSEFAGWSQDKTHLYYLSNVRDPKYMDLYAMDISTWTSKLIYQNEQGFQFDGISKDGRYLALTKIHTSNDTDLYLFDLNSKTLKHLTPHQGEISYRGSGFEADSQSLYFITDENSEFSYLKRYDIKTGKTAVVEKADWDFQYCFLSPSGRYRVTGTNEDGKSVVKVYDQIKHHYLQLPSIVEGSIDRVIFADSEQSMLLYVNGDRTASNLYLYDLKTGTARKMTDSMCPDIDQEDLVEAEIIRYPSYDGLMIPALYYKPQGIPKGHKVPAMLWIHGGPGGQSCKGYHFLIQYLVNHGYAILAVNNRGSSGYGKTFFQAADLKHGEADLDDCIWAKKYLISTGDIDENKIGIMGGSYGGYMTLAALTFRPEEMAVGVDIFGVSNWVRTLSSIPPWWEATRDALYKKIGHPETQSAYLKSISPLFHAQRIKKPLLVLQGANDPRVLKAESDQIIEAVSQNGIPYRYVLFADEGHGFESKQNRIAAGKAILEFLDEHLKQ